MIDPYNITRYDYSDAELEELILFCIAVAGKTAYIITEKIDAFLKLDEGRSPFDKIRMMLRKGTLELNLKAVKLGKYSVLTRGYKELADLRFNLRTCSINELEAITGISHKTARFFVLHSRKDPGQIACIDTHVKKWLQQKGYNGNYFALEQAFLKELAMTNKTAAELDLEIWRDNAKFRSTAKVR